MFLSSVTYGPSAIVRSRGFSRSLIGLFVVGSLTSCQTGLSHNQPVTNGAIPITPKPNTKYIVLDERALVANAKNKPPGFKSDTLEPVEQFLYDVNKTPSFADYFKGFVQEQLKTKPAPKGEVDKKLQSDKNDLGLPGSPWWIATKLGGLDAEHGVVYSDFNSYAAKDKDGKPIIKDGNPVTNVTSYARVPNPSLGDDTQQLYKKSPPTLMYGQNPIGLILNDNNSRLWSADVFSPTTQKQQDNPISIPVTSYGQGFVVLEYAYVPVALPSPQPQAGAVGVAGAQNKGGQVSSAGMGVDPSVGYLAPASVQEINARQNSVFDATTIKGGVVYVPAMSRSIEPTAYVSVYPFRIFRISHDTPVDTGTWRTNPDYSRWLDFVSVDIGVIPSTSTFSSTPNSLWAKTVPFIGGVGYDLSGIPALIDRFYDEVNADLSTPIVIPIEIVTGVTTFPEQGTGSSRWRTRWFVGVTIDGLNLLKSLIGSGSGGSSSSTPASPAAK
jgi:hypothetical protein